MPQTTIKIEVKGLEAFKKAVNSLNQSAGMGSRGAGGSFPGVDLGMRSATRGTSALVSSLHQLANALGDLNRGGGSGGIDTLVKSLGLLSVATTAKARLIAKNLDSFLAGTLTQPGMVPVTAYRMTRTPAVADNPSPELDKASVGDILPKGWTPQPHEKPFVKEIKTRILGQVPLTLTSGLQNLGQIKVAGLFSWKTFRIGLALLGVALLKLASITLETAQRMRKLSDAAFSIGDRSGSTGKASRLGIDPDRFASAARAFRERLSEGGLGTARALEYGLGYQRARGPKDEAKLLMDALQKLSTESNDDTLVQRARDMGLEDFLPEIRRLRRDPSFRGQMEAAIDPELVEKSEKLGDSLQKLKNAVDRFLETMSSGIGLLTGFIDGLTWAVNGFRALGGAGPTMTDAQKEQLRARENRSTPGIAVLPGAANSPRMYPLSMPGLQPIPYTPATGRKPTLKPGRTPNFFGETVDFMKNWWEGTFGGDGGVGEKALRRILPPSMLPNPTRPIDRYPKLVPGVGGRWPKYPGAMENTPPGLGGDFSGITPIKLTPATDTHGIATPAQQIVAALGANTKAMEENTAIMRDGIYGGGDRARRAVPRNLADLMHNWQNVANMRSLGVPV